jgi:hypothetical protein
LPAYRLYRLDGAGNFTSAEWFEAEADEAALSHAQGQTDGRFELWDRGRLVGRSGTAPR